MATLFQERAGMPQKRKIAMYGKSAKRRIPEFSFAAMSSPTSEVFEIPDEVARPNAPIARPTGTVRSTSPTKFQPAARISPARSLESEDIFAVPEDDEKTPTPKKVAAPILKAKTKPVQKKQAASVKSSVDNPSTADIWDVPGDDEIEKNVPQRARTPPKSKPIAPKQIAKSAALDPTPKADIWDVPGDDEAPKIIQQRARTPPKPKPVVQKQISKPNPISLGDFTKSVTLKPALVRPRARKSPSMSPDSSPKKISIYDVPSETDEKPPPSAKKRSHQAMQKSMANATMQCAAVEVLQPAPEKSNKKLRISPVRDTAMKLVPAQKPAAQATRTLPAARSLPSRDRSPVKMAQMVARPKMQAPSKKPEPVRAIRQVTPTSQSIQPVLRTPPKKDIEMTNAIPDPPKPLSPRGLKILQNLMDSVENSEEECVVKSARKLGRTQAASSAFRSILSRPAGVVKSRSPKLPARRRLIDTLVEQKQDSEEESSDASMSDSIDDSQQTVEIMEIPDSQVVFQPTSRPPMTTSISQISQGPRKTYSRMQSFVGQESQTESQTASRPPLMTSDSQMSQGGSRTYGRMRSYMGEADILADLDMELPSQSVCNAGPRRVGAPAMLSRTSSSIDDDDHDNKPAISSVHELRLAGVNNRFMDNVQDCLGQIGKPAKTPAAKTARRAGLMDLASKMKDKSFMKQFRDNAIEQRLFLHLDQETDVVSGFLLVSILLQVISDGILPHLVSQLRQQGLSELLTLLVGYQSSIKSVGRERKTNMSKVAQTLLAAHHDHLVENTFWEDMRPDSISPRTLALKCLEVLAKQTGASEFVHEEVVFTQFTILASASDERFWALPKDKSAIDFYLALTILANYCATTGISYDQGIWTNTRLPIIANTLEHAIAKPVNNFGQLQMLVLQLTVEINVHSPETCELFIKHSLLSAMARAIVSMFEKILPMTEEDPALILLTDQLIILLFATCQLAEWSSKVGVVLQFFEGHENDPLKSMIHIFTANREKMSMADSLEETRKNSPFGHLAVLLGQLALSTTICKRIQDSQQRKSLSPLIDSIEDFTSLHRTVDSQRMDEDEFVAHDPLVERLESLLEKLNNLR